MVTRPAPVGSPLMTSTSMGGLLGSASPQEYTSLRMDDESEAATPGSALLLRSGARRCLPRELASWRCGSRREALRQAFNLCELRALRLLASSAREERLGPREQVRHLLEGLADSCLPGDDEVELVLRVADAEQAEVLAQDQVLFAIRAWYAWCNLPAQLDAALASLFPGGGAPSPVPPAETLHSLLLDLNEQQPVETCEAAAVRELALCLGAREDAAEAWQLRQALAVWYLHVERPRTDPADLVRGSVCKAHHWIMRHSGAQSIWEGRCDLKAEGTRILLLLVVLLGAVLPSFEFWVSRRLPTPVTCEHPHLGDLLHATGFLGLVLSTAALATSGATKARVHAGMSCTWTFTCTTGFILAAVHMFGLSQVLTSTSSRCGVVLWHLCHFVYLTVPTLLVFCACCALPCLYCCIGGSEVLEDQGADALLTRI